MSNVDNMRSLRERQPKSKAVTHDSTHDRGEMKEMLEQVDLLSMIRDDTGESGYEASDYIAFHDCPICGHHDCFRYYPLTNSWHCFSESNMSGYEGGSALEYFKATRNDNDTAAVAWLRDLTDHPYQGNAGEEPTEPDVIKTDDFPPITKSKIIEPPKRAPVLIDGILRHGHTLLVTARSKAGKTFLMLELGVAVACGKKWLGRKCDKGRVLFVNPEVDPPSAENRLHEVAKGMGVNMQTVANNFDFWHLRGHAQGIEETSRALFKRVTAGDYTLVIFDSVYELYTGDENSAEDARNFFHEIDGISEKLNCSIAMTHHHAKGSRSDMDALDRGSGSGVFGRKPDAPIDLMQVFPVSEDDIDNLDNDVTVWRVSDSGLREFPAMETFDVYFKYPLHFPVTDHATDGFVPRGQITDAQKSAAKVRKLNNDIKRKERELQIASYFIANGIGRDGAPASEVSREALGGMKLDRLKNLVEQSEYFGTFKPSQNRLNIVPLEHRTDV